MVHNYALVALDECLERLAKEDPQSAELVKLRYYLGAHRSYGLLLR
jgi:hypothetical protein